MADEPHISADDAFDLLKDIIVREFEVPPESILVEAGLEDMDLDSIDAVDLVISVEQAIGFEFKTEDVSEFRTLQDIVDLLSGVRARSG